ncbi:hypothetical protein [Halioxenophilus aromaticivorans]|uniref:Uncharacterized protein n=1 Tax=Halioxenophilus aromaticivorans TaxID=1306992 RepID=A0AAV3UA47_9ALTE
MIDGLVVNRTSDLLNAHLKVSNTNDKSPSISNQNGTLIIDENYIPDFSLFDNVKEGDRIRLTTLNEDELNAFFELNPQELIKRIDLTNTTKNELYATLMVLDFKGQIDDVAGGNLSIQVGLDSNLDHDIKFNALEYFEKTINGMQNIPGYSAGSDVLHSFLRGYNTLLAMNEAKQADLELKKIDETV